MRKLNIFFSRLFGFTQKGEKGEKGEKEYWWHAPSSDFNKYDISKIGMHSQNYGWGIYFADTAKNAASNIMLPQSKPIDHIYRLDPEKIEGLAFIHYSKDLADQIDEVKAIATTFYGKKQFESIKFKKNGHGFYNDILHVEQITSADQIGCAAHYLVNAGIHYGYIKSHTSMLVIYDTSLWVKVERLALTEDLLI